MTSRKYRKVAVGGSFDVFHKGHARLIDKALEVGDAVLIGLSTDKMLQSYLKSHSVAAFPIRKAKLLTYLVEKRGLARAEVVPIEDPYGPTLSDSRIEALVVSRETLFRGREINRLRKKKGLNLLEIVVIDLILADDGSPISSTRIKRGEIDRCGRLTRP
jgi:pantetheine-phosphate adenylyltransferase